MESVKNIRNDELVKAYEALHTDDGKERQAAVTRQMVHAVFLLPVTAGERQAPRGFAAQGTEKRAGSDVSSLVYRRRARGKSHRRAEGDVLLPIDISDAYAYLVDKPELRGLIVNPFSKPNLVCVRPIVGGKSGQTVEPYQNRRAEQRNSRSRPAFPEHGPAGKAPGAQRIPGRRNLRPERRAWDAQEDIEKAPDVYGAESPGR